MKGTRFIAFVNSSEEGNYIQVEVIAPTLINELDEDDEWIEIEGYLCWSIKTRKIFKVGDYDFIEIVLNSDTENQITKRIKKLEKDFKAIIDSHVNKTEEIAKEIHKLVELGYSHKEALDMYNEIQASKQPTPDK